MNKCGKHPNKALILVCRKEGCNQQRLCCILCYKQHQNHSEEDIIDIEEFVFIVGKSRLDKSSIEMDNERLVKQLENHMAQCIEKLQGMLDSLRKNITNRFSQLKERMSNKSSLVTSLEQHGHLNNIPAEQLSKIIKDEVETMLIRDKQQKWVRSSKMATLTWNSATQRVLEQLRSFERTVFNTFNSSYVLDDCQWSQKLKNKAVIVEGSKASRNTSFGGWWAVVLADFLLDPQVANKYQWTIIPQNSVNSFTMGACLEHKAVEQKFTDGQYMTQLYHGHYIFNKDNWINNSIDPQTNDKRSSYSTQEVLPFTVCVDFTHRTICLKQQNKVLIQMMIEMPKEPMRPVLWIEDKNAGSFRFGSMKFSK